MQDNLTFSFDFCNIFKPQEGYTLVQLHNLTSFENTSASVSRVKELPLFRHVNPYCRAYNVRQLSTFQRGVEAFEGVGFQQSGQSPFGMKDMLATGFVIITKPLTSVPHRGTVLKDMAVKCNF